MSRRSDPDPVIGQRIKTRRLLRGWSVRYAADRAGMSHSNWSRIERGVVAADNRFTVAAIAAALECSVADLAGHSLVFADESSKAAQARVPAVRCALLELDLACEAGCDPRPVAHIAAEVELVRALSVRCDLAGIGDRLPRLLRELHALVIGGEPRTGSRLLVDTLWMARNFLVSSGYPGDAWIAAERCRQAAQVGDDPVMLGYAALNQALVCTSNGAYKPALRIAELGVKELEPHLSAERAMPMLGMLQLAAGFSCHGLGRADDGVAWLDDAAVVAAHTGETADFGHFFGPTNVGIWRSAAEADAGDPGKAVELASQVQPMTIPSPDRQANFYRDTARALSHLGTRDADARAVRMLLTAERLAPQRIHLSPVSRETARGLLERSPRRARNSEIRGLCERMGLAT